jgi:hypothetical protein
LAKHGEKAALYSTLQCWCKRVLLLVVVVVHQVLLLLLLLVIIMVTPVCGPDNFPHCCAASDTGGTRSTDQRSRISARR